MSTRATKSDEPLVLLPETTKPPRKKRSAPGQTVYDKLMWRYAKAIEEAIAEHDGREASGNDYFRHVNVRYSRYRTTREPPADIGRQNEQTAERWDQCAYCQSEQGLSKDHIVPIWRGGPDSFDNWIRACAACNSSKRATPLGEWVQKHGKEPSRLVWLKHLKVLYAAHDRANTLDLYLDELPPSSSELARLELAVFPVPSGMRP